MSSIAERQNPEIARPHRRDSRTVSRWIAIALFGLVIVGFAVAGAVYTSNGVIDAPYVGP